MSVHAGTRHSKIKQQPDSYARKPAVPLARSFSQNLPSRNSGNGSPKDGDWDSTAVRDLVTYSTGSLCPPGGRRCRGLDGT